MSIRAIGNYYELDDDINGMYDMHIDKIMEKQRKETLEKLSTIATPSYVEEFAGILCTAWSNGCQISEALFCKLGFDMSTVFAVDEDFTAFKKYYEQNKRYEV